MSKLSIKSKDFFKFIKEIKQNKYHINQDYQRSNVWTQKHNKEFIADLLKGIFIGLFIFDKKGEKYDIIDGQQRYNAINEFINDRIEIDNFENYPSFNFSNLKNGEITDSEGQLSSLRDLYSKLTKYRINFLLMDDMDDEEIAQLFLSINSGVALNAAEKLNAETGWFRKIIYNLSMGPPFNNKKEKGIGLSPFRFKYREICAQLIKLEFDRSRGELLKKSEFRIRQTDLKLMYQKYKYQNSSNSDVYHLIKAKRRVIRILKFINRLHEETRVLIDEVTFFRTLYCVISDIYEKNKQFSNEDLNKIDSATFDFLIGYKMANKSKKDYSDFPKRCWPVQIHRDFLKSKGGSREDEWRRIDILRIFFRKRGITGKIK